LSSALGQRGKCCATKIGSGNVSESELNSAISAGIPPAEATIATAPAG
jgi:hypothetical protein